MLAPLIQQLAAACPLTPTQVRQAVEALVNEAVPAADKAEFLSALARKGETVEEISAFALALREKSVLPPMDPTWRASREILDVCGTGGDQLGTFNISTTVAMVCAAAGVAVAKHGNRAITSQAGSADVLEALGIRIDLPPAAAVQSLRERNFAFFFAPNFHPAFKHIAPARKLCAERKQRTIFNFLGPLLNPARPTAQLMGVPRVELCEPLARVLQSLGLRRGMVVCGSIESNIQGPKSGVLSENSGLAAGMPPEPAGRTPALPNAAPASSGRVHGASVLRDSKSNAPTGAKVAGGAQSLDELSTLGTNVVAEFYQERGFAVSALDASQLPLQPATLDDLRGGDRNANAEIIRRILSGAERGPKRDAVLLNAGAALFVAGAARSVSAGWDLAAAVIDDGRAAAKLKELAAG